MSNSKRHQERRAARAKTRKYRPRFNINDYPDTPPPALGTVRNWLKQAEREGKAERKGVEHTGKPGRPAHLWGLPDQPRETAD